MQWAQVVTMLRERAERTNTSEVARELRVPRSTLVRWINGEREPTGLTREAVYQWAETRLRDDERPAAAPSPLGDAKHLAVLEGRAVEVEAIMAYALERQRLVIEQMRHLPRAQAAGAR